MTDEQEATSHSVARAVVLAPGQGTWLSPRAGTQATIKALGSDTQAAYSVVEWEHQPDAPGPPLHVHDGEEEAFYLLSGMAIVTVGDEQSEAGAGTFVVVPRGTPHTFSVVGDQPVRMLIMLSPPCYEGFWEELSGVTNGGKTQPSPETMAALGAKYRMRVEPARL